MICSWIFQYKLYKPSILENPLFMEPPMPSLHDLVCRCFPSSAGDVEQQGKVEKTQKALVCSTNLNRVSLAYGLYMDNLYG